LGIVVVYAIASFADGSLADVSGPVEAAIVAGVAVVLLLCHWLLSREGSASPSGVTERTISAGGDARAAAWPPGKFAPTTTPTGASTLPTVARAWGASASPTTTPTGGAAMPTVARAWGASTAEPGAPAAGTRAPTAAAVDRNPPPGARDRGTREIRSTRDTTFAFHGQGGTSALDEYLDGRTELVDLIARSEARLPADPEPSAHPDATAQPGADDAYSLAQNTKMLTQAVEHVARACELIAHAFELFAERVESDRLERRTLADAVMVLAQQAAPAASTPRPVSAGPARERVLLEDDIALTDPQSIAGDLGVATRSP
jgi:hypothetical protein